MKGNYQIHVPIGNLSDLVICMSYEKRVLTQVMFKRRNKRHRLNYLNFILNATYFQM